MWIFKKASVKMESGDRIYYIARSEQCKIATGCCWASASLAYSTFAGSRFLKSGMIARGTNLASCWSSASGVICLINELET